MRELMQALQPTIMNLAVVIVTYVASYIGLKVKAYLDEKLQSETKKQVAKDTVKYVEQVYSDLHGDEKKYQAFKKAIEVLNEKNINITHEELDLLVESAVNSFRNGLGK